MSKKFGSLFNVTAALLPHRDVYFTPFKPHIARFLAGMSNLPCKPFALTCGGKTDGGGAQVQAIMSVMAFCHAFGYRYAHTPFKIIEHTKGPAEIAAWEGLFNLGAGEITAADMGMPIIKAGPYMKAPARWLRDTVVEVEYLHPFVDAHPEAYLPVRDSLRRKYQGVPIARDPAVTTVAVHIRRGDVSQSTHQQRYTSNGEIVARVRAVRAACEAAGKQCRFVVHSQGAPDDFAELAREGCDLRLNIEALTSFNELVHADILLMAKSSFSYVAGILSKGIIVYEPFWCTSLPDWINVDHLELVTQRLRPIAL